MCAWGGKATRILEKLLLLLFPALEQPKVSRLDLLFDLRDPLEMLAIRVNQVVSVKRKGLLWRVSVHNYLTVLSHLVMAHACHLRNSFLHASLVVCW